MQNIYAYFLLFLEQSKEIYLRVKTALKLMEYTFPDDDGDTKDIIPAGPAATSKPPPPATAGHRKRVTTQQSAEQSLITATNLEEDLV